MPRRRPDFAKIRARNDALVWRAIHSRPVPGHDRFGLEHSGRSGDFEELGRAVERGEVFGYAFAHFLDEFYLFRRPSFFAKEPPVAFPPRRRAFLAGVAEYLSNQFDLDPPEWIGKPEYFLSEEWDYVSDFEEFPEELRDRIDERRARATPEFLRRGIIYEARNLLRL